MTISLTYRDLGNPHFITGAKKLTLSDKWKSPSAAYSMARLSAALDEELRIFNELRRTFARKWNEARKEEGKDKEADARRLQALQDEADKFADVTVSIERSKIDFSELDGLNLTPVELLALTPLLDNLPD